MATRLVQVVIDALAPRDLAVFWAEALGWRIVIDEPDEVEIAGTDDDVNIGFVPTSDPKVGKNRVHLDLWSATADHQRETVERLIGLGARRVDIGQGDVPWVVLADPEGNEFCVLPPGHYDVETGPVAAICMPATDRRSLRAFWSTAASWPPVARGLHRGTGPFMVFGGGAPAAKVGKNRIHLDVAPPLGGDHHAEADRLIELGATRVDIGQRDVPWVVMADPEGNEFCVLTPR